MATPSGSDTKIFTYRGKAMTVAGNFDQAGLIGVTPQIFAWLDPILDIVLPPDGVAIDVGANVGIVTAMLAARLPRGQVIAIEPDPSNLGFLRRTAAASGAEIAIVPTACGDRPGWVRLAFEGPHVVAEPVEAPGTAAGAAAGVRVVPVQSLDEIVASQGLRRVDFVKIDVEGFEPRVLDGMARTLAQHAPWVAMEFNSFTLSLAGVALLPFLQHLRALFGTLLLVGRNGGYFAVESGGDLINALHTNLVQHGAVSDLVLIPHGDARAGQLRAHLNRSAVEPGPGGGADEVVLRQALHAARARNATLREAIRQIEQSKAWRLTAPLRWARRRLRRAR